jgi:voltage-gated potassium channel
MRERVVRFAAAFAGTHIRLWITVVALAAVVGTFGYVVFFAWPIGDAFYMTMISLTTVGFREVRDLDQASRLWTVLIAVAGVGIIFGSIGIVTEAVLGQLGNGKREAQRMRETVAALEGHYIVCGYGRVGSTVARELEHDGQRPVVIDVLPESLERARNDGHLTVAGDATSDATLSAAGIERARGLITAIDSDANNVYVALSARALNSGLFIVGRANSLSAESKLRQAGADRVVSPYTMAGRRIAHLAIRPRVTDFIDAALSHGDLSFSMEDIEVSPGSRLDGRSVGELRAEGIFTLAIVRDDRTYEANPPDDHRLRAGDQLILSGAAKTLAEVVPRG